MAALRAFLVELRRAARPAALLRGHAVVAVVTMALGVGANALVFSVVKGVLLDPLPYPETGRLDEVSGVRIPVDAPYPLSYLDIQGLEERSTAYTAVAAHTGLRSFNLLADGRAEHVSGELVESDYFRLLGAEPRVGRVLAAAEDVEGEHRVVVLSHGLWVRSFGTDPAIVGRSVELDGRTFQVVGIAEEGFRGLSDQADLWLPLTLAPTLYGGFYLAARPFRWLSALAQRAPGVGVEEGRLDLERAAAELREDFPAENLEIGARPVPLTEHFFGSLRPRLLLLWGAAAFVLLIAVANLAALLLARGTAAARATAIRAALGADRLAVGLPSLAEAVVVSAGGAVLGLAAAALLLAPILERAALGLPGFSEPGLDLAVAGWMGGAAVVAAAVAALAPALTAARTGAVAALTRDARGSGSGRGGARLLRVFVALQIAVAFVLVVAVGRTVEGFRRLAGVDPGFRTAGVVTARVDLKAPRFADDPAYWQLVDELHRRAAALPGVASAALAGPQPLVGSWNGAEVSVEARTEAGLDPNGLMVVTRSVTPGFFSTLGIPLLAGRDLAAGDRDVTESELVVVINRTFAEGYFEGSAVGQRIKLSRPDQDGPLATVVGVVGDVVDGGPGAETRPTDLQIYYSVYQVTPRLPPTLTVVVAAGAAPGVSPAGSVRSVIAELRALTEGWAGDLPLFDVRSLDEQLARQTAGPRFLVRLMSAFAVLAVGLATVGLHGVVSYTVGRQLREMGVRLALGATPTSVAGLVIRRALATGAVGAGLGLGLVWLLQGAVGGWVPGLEVAEGGGLGAAVAVSLVICAVAASFPGLRAARTAPGVVMEEG